MSTRTLLVGALATVLLGTLPVTAARAGCTLRDESSLVKRSISRQIRCNDKRLRHGPAAPCKLSAPPACAGTLVGDAVALGYGPNNPPAAQVDAHAVRGQLKCQRQVGKGISSYVGTKLRGLIRNDNIAALEPKARRHLDRVPDRCLLNVEQDVGSGILVPAVGPQCGAAVGADGTPVQGVALRDCVYTLLQVWVDRWGPNPQPLRPNILFILTDDQRWDTTDATHSPTGAFIMPRTRAELADKGVEFSGAFMTTPLCCPSRSSILRGQYAHRTGVYKNGGNNGGADDFDDSSSIATWLQGAGYRTSLLGKYLNGYQALWNQNTQPPYVPPGWTDWHGMRNVAYFNYKIVDPDGMGGYTLTTYGGAPEDYSTDVLRERAKAFISDAVGQNQRFFLYLAFKAPHLPQTPAPRHEGMFQSIPPWRPPSYNEADVSDKPTWVQNTTPMTPAEQADLDQVRIDQLEMVQAVDEAIGGSTTYGITGIVEHLQNLGVLNDTMIVYFSDNGWYWGEHRFRAKNKPYEEAIRAPMFVRYSKLAPLPRKETRFALNIDLASTFAELVGAGVPIFEDGMSLMKVIDGTQPAWRTDFLTEGWPGGHPWATVRESQWKYTETPLTPGSPTTLFDLELYDLVNDPYELTNVASDPQHAARITQMAARLRQLRQNWPVDSDPNGPDPDEDE
jgi:N-acetylglucosamine-6-sulfatase